MVIEIEVGNFFGYIHFVPQLNVWGDAIFGSKDLVTISFAKNFEHLGNDS